MTGHPLLVHNGVATLVHNQLGRLLVHNELARPLVHNELARLLVHDELTRRTNYHIQRGLATQGEIQE